MIASSAAIFKLRRETKHLDGTGIFKMKLYPWIPLFFIANYAFVGISIALQDLSTALTGLIVLGVFMVIFFISKKFKTV
jgi:APA family basic amino acid/polyamine antiporter